MRKYSTVALLGTITHAFPRVIQTANGDFHATEITVANNTVVGGRKVPVFTPVSVVGKQAEILADRLVVGANVFVGGELREDVWEKTEDDGRTHPVRRLKVHASRVELLAGDFEMTQPKAGQTSLPRVAQGLNTATVAGNLTANPVSRRVGDNGDLVANFTVAMNRKYTDRAGAEHEEVSYVEVTLWRDQAQQAFDTLKRGDAVIVDGHLTSETWTGRDGQPRQALRVESQRFFPVQGGPRPAAEVSAPVVTEQDLPPVVPEPLTPDQVFAQLGAAAPDHLPQ